MKIQEKDFIEISKQEGIGIAELKAVMHVEARGSGHLPDGRPKILFEGHKFYKHLSKNPALRDKACKERPDLCFKTWTKQHYKGGAAEWQRLDDAVQYDREAALKSASYGAFQIMGENYAAAGFKSVQDMVNAMFKSEREHLVAVCKFIKSWPKMYNALLRHDWATFAECYNGPAYKANGYHIQMETAFTSFSKK